MPVSAAEILTEVQLLLLEPPDGGATFPSLMWEPAEVLRYAGDYAQDLQTAVGVHVSRVSWPLAPPASPGVLRQALPQDWLATVACAWLSQTTGRWTPLERAEVWELDAIIPSWRSSSAAKPRFFTEADGELATLQLVPAPFDSGVLEVLYVASPTDPFSSLPLSGDLAPGFVWGTIYRMLGKAGRGNDPARAAIAKQFADLTAEALKLIISGRL